MRSRVAVRASGAAGFGASAERFVDNGLDGARASATLGAAAEAAIDLLGITRKLFGGAHGITDIVVAEDVAGADNHENWKPIGDAKPEIFKTAALCKRKNRVFK
jgi:hypothetical protein